MMRSRFWLFLLLVLGMCPVARAQYDDCATAGLSSFQLYGTFDATTTIDGGSSCQTVPHPDLWWMYRPLTTGVVHLAICGNSVTTVVDALASLHDSCPGIPANEIACNDDGNLGSTCYAPGSSELFAPVTAGHLYYLRVSSTNGVLGVVNVAKLSGPDPTPAPNSSRNSACAVLPGLIHGISLNQSPWDSVWFSYTPIANGMVVADTCGIGAGDTAIQVWQDTNFLGWNDDWCGLESSYGWQATAGVEYQIGYFYSSDLGATYGPFTLRLTGPPAAQADCTTAPFVTEGSRWLSFENAAANGSSACDTGGLPALYYKYVAPADGLLTVTTLGSDDEQFPDVGEDTLLSLHAGCPATSANTIVCNDTAPASGGLDEGVLADAAVHTFVTAGQLVTIRVARVGAGAPDSTVPARLNVAFTALDFDVCAGDGTGSPCPCSNSGSSGNGCASSQDSGGAHLDPSGEASVSSDTLDLQGTHMPASGTAMYVQGTVSAASGAGVPFGDGLRCVSGTVRRLGVRTSVGGASSFGFASGAHVSVAGQIPPSGGVRVYQIWYRDAMPFCTSAVFNFSNGLSISWGP